MKQRCYKWRKDYDWKTHCTEEAKMLSIEKRQEFMDYMVKDHLNLGEAALKADLNFDQSCGILNMQIKSSLYLENVIKE